MKVMMVSQGYPTEKYPMNGIHELTFARILKYFGLEVFIVGIDMRSIKHHRKWGFSKCVLEEIPIYSYSIPGGRLSAKILGNVASFGLKKAYQHAVKEQGEPDIVHAHFFDRAYPFAKINQKLRLPFVISEHSSAMNQKFLEKDLKEVGTYAYTKADLVLVGSNAFAKQLQENFPIQPRVIQTIANLDKFHPIEVDPYDEFTFVACGNLKRAKGQMDIVNAFFKAFQGSSNVKLLLIGEGEDRKNLKERIQELKLEKQVEFLGHLNQEEINRIFNRSHVFVHASHSETYGKVIVEAINAGLPVLCSKCGGGDDLLNTSNGVYFKVEDVEGLANRMREIKDSYHLYDRDRIAEEAKKEYSEEYLVEKYKKLYEMVVGKYGRK